MIGGQEGKESTGTLGYRNIPPHNHISSLSACNPFKWSGRTAIRFSNAPTWSGIMTSHSWRGALLVAIVRYRLGLDIGRIVGLGLRMVVLETRNKERGASIYVGSVGMRLVCVGLVALQVTVRSLATCLRSVSLCCSGKNGKVPTLKLPV